MNHNQRLALISKAWGRQSGYCFFPWISGRAEDKKARILSYTEGPAFLWPDDRSKILDHLAKHEDDDLYWCPSLFEGPRRRMELAMDEHALWADLDAVNPHTLEDYPPTYAWETSPKRYQALWIISGGDMQGASWPGKENQRLTYHIDADPSGWDTTQLLRLPGWKNHKPEYRRRDGSAPEGRLVIKAGRRWLVDEFNDLPEVPNATVVVEVLEEEIERIDRQAVWGRVRLKVSQRVRELVAARSTTGDRSDALWEMERELADAGCSIPEIVAVVRETVWNKFAGRSDEIRRLTTEASKAVAQMDDPHKKAIEAEVEAGGRPEPMNLFDLVRDMPAPQWLIRDVLTAGAVGFIAGQPKSYKSWTALDMGLSVASGQPFLNHFAVEDPGPVLYIQEEDSGPMVKRRLNKIWPRKLGDTMKMQDGELVWLPAQENVELPPISGYIGNTFVISDPTWQVWLDEVLEKGYNGTGIKYRLIILDPLMMMAGEVEENRAQQMTEHVFKPLKQLARKHSVAIQVVHHMKKGDPRAPQRGGQLLLGSVANHAWAEDSMYFKLGRHGSVIAEQESKQAPVPGFTISHIRNRDWAPVVTVNPSDDPDDITNNGLTDKSPPLRKAIEQGRKPKPKQARPPKTEPKAITTLKTMVKATGDPTHGFTASEVAQVAGITRQAAAQSLNRSPDIQKTGSQYHLKGAQ